MDMRLGSQGLQPAEPRALAAFPKPTTQVNPKALRHGDGEPNTNHESHPVPLRAINQLDNESSVSSRFGSSPHFEHTRCPAVAAVRLLQPLQIVWRSGGRYCSLPP